MRKILYNFLGYSKFELVAFNATYISTKLLEEFHNGIFDVTISDDNKHFSFCCYSFSEKKIRTSNYLKDTNILDLKRFGVPEKINKNRNRIGILVGIVLFVFILQVHKLLVWDIVISGNNNMSEEEIIETLELAGFSKGSLIHPEKISSVCNKCIILNKDITWISINMSGTVAFVEVSERIEGENTIKPSLSGLVSNSDGIIELVKVTSGTSLVKKGDSVTKGQMLISPIAKGRDENEYIVGAGGEVIAKTYENFLVIVNYIGSSQLKSKPELYRYSLNFLGKDTKLKFSLFDKKNHYYVDNFKGKVRIFNNIILPVSYKKMTRTAYEISEIILTPEQAKDIAFSKTYEIINSELNESEILSTHFSEETTEDSFILRCEVECLKNVVEYR